MIKPCPLVGNSAVGKRQKPAEEGKRATDLRWPDGCVAKANFRSSMTRHPRAG